MQAGLVDTKLSFGDVFTAVARFVSFVVALIWVRWRRQELVSRCAVAWHQ